ncbi:MAG: hypothetical protein ABI068_15980 [Ktedonobacterales bacterium]
MTLIQWVQRPAVRAGVLALACVVGIVSAIGFVAYPAFLAAPDRVQVVVTSGLTPTTQQVIFDQTFTTAIAPQVYAQLISGNRIPPNTVESCPTPRAHSLYYQYTLTFSHMGIQTGVASGDAVECMMIQLTYPVGAPAYFSYYDTQNRSSFWVELHHLTNAPEPVNCVCPV